MTLNGLHLSLRSVAVCYVFAPALARRDPERGLQSWFRPAKPETRNPKPTVKVGFELRNPKPETESEDLTSPGPIETRNPKPTLKTYLPQDRSKPETRSPKPTAKVGFNRRNPKPETDSESWFQSTKPETRNRLESDFWVALRIGTRISTTSQQNRVSHSLTKAWNSALIASAGIPKRRRHWRPTPQCLAK